MDRIEPQASAGTTAILYVDDEEMARKYFARSLGADYEVLTAPDADAAMGVLRDKKGQIDIFVTDFRMPGRDGADLLRQIACEFPHVMRILVTAYADRAMLLDTANSGEVFRIFEKPLDFAEFGIALRLATELSRNRRAKRQKLMALEETIAFLAHEMNTPLAAITNFARGMQHRVANRSVLPLQQAEIGKAALAMDVNARFCLSLLSSFVESVQGAGEPSVHHASSTAHQVILSLLDTYPLTPSQRFFIHIDIKEDFRIATLPNCVALVLSSLLSNALRALQDRPAPMICFSVLVDGNPQIRVADNGPGIPPEILQRLQIDPVTTHADAGGKGWGMIFCKRIMQLFGGGIVVHSVPDTHTTVTLNFPAIKVNKRSDP